MIQNVVIESRSDSLATVKRYSKGSFDHKIQSFHIDLSPSCRFIPRGINVPFNHLTVLAITHSGLTAISTKDLKVFKHLKGLYLNNNKLQALQGHLFKFNPGLEEINFSNNHLKHITYDILDSLQLLQKAEFYDNKCFDIGAENSNELNKLKDELRSKFQPPSQSAELPTSKIIFKDGYEAECCFNQGCYEYNNNPVNRCVVIDLIVSSRDDTMVTVKSVKADESYSSKIKGFAILGELQCEFIPAGIKT